MLFMIGIEPATNKDEAYGMVVPVFSKFNYVCNSASDDESGIVSSVTEAILMIAEEMVLEGVDLEVLNEGYKDYSQVPEYEYFTRWLAVEVDLP